MSALRIGWTNPCHRAGHSVILELVKPELVQTPYDIIPTELHFRKRFQLIIDSHQDRINIVTDLAKHHIVGHADASKIVKGAGISTYGPKYEEVVPHRFTG